MLMSVRSSSCDASIDVPSSWICEVGTKTISRLFSILGSNPCASRMRILRSLNVSFSISCSCGGGSILTCCRGLGLVKSGSGGRSALTSGLGS